MNQAPSILLRQFVAASLLVCGLLASTSQAQRELGARGTESGGPLLPEQAAYDVKFYDLALRVNTEERSIAGALTVRALIVQPTEWFVLDLDMPLKVSAVEAVDEAKKTHALRFERRGGRIWIAFPSTRQPGETVNVRVHYAGVPRVAPRPLVVVPGHAGRARSALRALPGRAGRHPRHGAGAHRRVLRRAALPPLPAGDEQPLGPPSGRARDDGPSVA